MGLDGCVILVITLLFGSRRARADPIVEFSGSTGFGVLSVGVTSGRFALSPSASFSVRGEGGERGFFVVRDTASFLGATGGRFEINNETTPRIQRQPRAVESARAFRFSSKRERWYT